MDRPEGTVIALCHLLFNLSGVILIYIIPWLRRIPLYLAERLAERASENKWYVPIYVGSVFFLIPGLFVIATVLTFNFLGDGLRDAADPYK